MTVRTAGTVRTVRTAFAVLAVLTVRLAAQDTVQVIRPEARADSLARPALPPAVLDSAIAAWNNPGTMRVAGGFLLPAGARIEGPVAVFWGSLRVAGTLVGRATVINGSLVIDPGGVVQGDVLVVGGRITVRPGGVHAGSAESWAPQAPLIRTTAGALARRPPPRPLGDLATASTSFSTGRFRTTLSIATGRTYNRVEGLPVVFGPTVVREGLPNVDGRLDLRGIAWTAPDRTERRAGFGYQARLEFRFGAARRLAVRAQGYRSVSPTEEHGLSAVEAGWAAFLFQRDYRDYIQTEGVGGQLSYRLGAGLTLQAGLRRDLERSVSAADPLSLFRNGSWRANPLADDGHYISWRLGAELDTRNDRESPASGWLVRGYWERSRSDDAAPVSLPAEVRRPIPPGRYAFSRVWIDARRYARFSPTVRTSARVLAAGWVAGDPLSVQHRLSLGGPGMLPALPFRSQRCAPAGLADAARSALCDRMIATQLEIRWRTRIGLPIPSPDPYLTGAQRLFAIREPDLVLFADAGKAWLTGEGPGRVPNHRIPVLREWQSDLGIGVDAGGLGFYVAKELGGAGLGFTMRLQRRF